MHLKYKTIKYAKIHKIKIVFFESVKRESKKIKKYPIA
jgi:hypothetical protein